MRVPRSAALLARRSRPMPTVLWALNALVGEVRQAIEAHAHTSDPATSGIGICRVGPPAALALPV